MGGENGGCTRAGVTTSGSSPRGRGKRNQPRRAHPAGRLIPARAGKTSHGPDHRLASTAHPRAGGENDHENILTIPQKGSSPRGRGKRRMVLTTGWPVRLIPARAGKTITRTSSRSRRRAHPRAGGENGTLAVQDLSATGSSPRGRGKRGGKVGLPIGARLIPARAGKTRSSGTGFPCGTAHPRAGGENH